MPVEALGYFGIRSSNLEDWTAYATRFLGMQLVEKTKSMLSLRMDDRKQRVIVNAGTEGGAAFFGWEVADAAALNALARTSNGLALRSHRAAGHSPTSGASRISSFSPIPSAIGSKPSMAPKSALR